jgi:hypothetical protein
MLCVMGMRSSETGVSLGFALTLTLVLRRLLERRLVAPPGRGNFTQSALTLH